MISSGNWAKPADDRRARLAQWLRLPEEINGLPLESNSRSVVGLWRPCRRSAAQFFSYSTDRGLTPTAKTNVAAGAAELKNSKSRSLAG